MKAIVHQTFGDVFNLDAGGFKRAAINNKFMCHPAAPAAKTDGEIVFQTLSHVVGA